MSVTVRHPRTDEAALVTAILNEHSRRLHGTDDLTAAELEEACRAPDLDFPGDVFLAEVNGKPVGYADVFVHGDSAWLAVRATEPGVYEPLIAAAVERAAETSRDYIRGWSPQEEDVVHQAYERAGFRPFRHSFRMEIELPEPSWPEGHTARLFRDGDERRIHRAYMDSFADTWGFAESSFESWAHWQLGELFQPEHWFLVEAGDELAGIALCRIRASEQGLGWIDILGVVPAHRRRGLALALLRHVFGHFAHLGGLERVGLGVGAENPTGAVRLYERAGMHVARRDVRYELVQP